MARRVVGRDRLVFDLERSKPQSTLDRLLQLNDWTTVEQRLREISSAAKGQPAWPSSVLFKVLLIAIHDRATFRRFRGFSAYEPTPERTAVVQLRTQPVARGLDHALFDEVTCSRHRAVHGTATLLRIGRDVVLARRLTPLPRECGARFLLPVLERRAA